MILQRSVQNILIVDDAKAIRDPLAAYMRKHGFRVTTAEDAAVVRLRLSDTPIDLVILDIMMPGEDGLSLCRWLFSEKDVPVIFLTAMASDTDRIVGLELGAEDYIVKPFNPRELLARVRIALRHRQPSLSGTSLTKRQFHKWVHDPALSHVQHEDGQIVGLTTYENRLLSILLDNANKVLSRAVLLDHVVGREEKVYDRAIDNQIGRLRKKLETDPANPTVLMTIWGGGYQLVADVRDVSGVGGT